MRENEEETRERTTVRVTVARVRDVEGIAA